MPAALSRFGTLTKFGSTLLDRWPIVELASSIITMTLTKVHSLLLELEIKTNKTHKSRSKLGCRENLRPLEFFFLKIYIIHGKLVSQRLVSRFVLWSRNVYRQQPERSEIFIISGSSLSGLSLAKFKITADILIAFAGEIFTVETEDTESLCCSN